MKYRILIFLSLVFAGALVQIKKFSFEIFLYIFFFLALSFAC